MSYCTTGWMAVTTLTHRVTVMMMPMMMMMMMIQAPLGSLFFLAYTQSRAPQTAPTGQGQAIRSMERQRQACCRPCSPASFCSLVGCGPTSYLHLLWAGLVWSGLVCERPRLNQRRHERGFPRSCITTCDTSYNCTRAGRQVVRRVGRLVETAAASVERRKHASWMYCGT